MRIATPLAVSLAALCVVAAVVAADDAAVAAFRADCAAEAKAAYAAEALTIVGEDGWLFLHNELRHISVGQFWGAPAGKTSRASRDPDPLPAILDYKAQLDKLGIELILIPVPPKAIVYADKLSKAAKADGRGVPARLDTAHQVLYQLLRDKGVTVLDLTDDFLAARTAAGGPAMFCQQDTHWSPAGCVLAARKVAELVKDRPWTKAIARKQYATQEANVEIAGDLWRDLKGVVAKPPQEKLAMRFVGTGGGPAGITALDDDPASPILLLADSHGLVFHAGGDMHAKGAGLADQLALEFGCPIEVVAVKGSGATPARISLYRKQKAMPGYLAGKKLLIWCFAAREFTESDGWRIVPVTRPEGT